MFTKNRKSKLYFSIGHNKRHTIRKEEFKKRKGRTLFYEKQWKIEKYNQDSKISYLVFLYFPSHNAKWKLIKEELFNFKPPKSPHALAIQGLVNPCFSFKQNLTLTETSELYVSFYTGETITSASIFL